MAERGEGVGTGGRRERKKATVYVPESAITTEANSDKKGTVQNGRMDVAEGEGADVGASERSGGASKAKAKGGGATSAKRTSSKQPAPAHDDNADLRYLETHSYRPKYLFPRNVN